MTQNSTKPSQSSQDQIINEIKSQIQNNNILLYMKGSPQMPQCGFSATATKILMRCGVEFAYINILENPQIRATLPQVANWPTFPQLYIKGELVGGSDIIQEMFDDGELQQMLKNI